MKITIHVDENSGFCFGVVNAIEKAEQLLQNKQHLYCLGDIVHNNKEMERLEKLGLQTISRDEYRRLKNATVLIRAHGEPPETYQTAMENNINLVDATCPVVLRLQEKVKSSFTKGNGSGHQVVIFGKKGHAEVNGLVGQTGGDAIVISSIDELNKIDFSRPVSLYSQTTKSKEEFMKIREEIENCFTRQGLSKTEYLTANDTTCRLVAKRQKLLGDFARQHELVIFVSGKKSSNGKMLYNMCKSINNNTMHISDPTEIDHQWLENIASIGICGATSTPRWLMEEVAEKLSSITNQG